MRVGAVTHRGYGQLVLRALRQGLGLVQRRRPAVHQPRYADRGVRRDPGRARVLPSRRRRRGAARGGPGAVHDERRPLLALGADRARLALFNGLFLVCDPGQAALGSVGARTCDVLAAAGRELQRVAAVGGLDDRRDRHALDDLLPAERIGRQGPDPARTSARPHRTPWLAVCWRRSSAVGALIVGAALLGHGGANVNGLAGAGFPAALSHVSGGPAAAIFALGLDRGRRRRDPTISASTGYAVGECIGVSAAASTTRRSRTPALLRRQHRRRRDRRRGDPDPGRAAAFDRAERERAGDGAVTGHAVFMVMLANDRGLMGRWVNKRSTNVIGIGIIAFVGVCGAAYGIDSFLQTVHLISG